MAVSHRARNDRGYRDAYVAYMAEAATARAFDPAYQALEAEMRQRVMGLQYSGNMMSPTVAPDSFWPMVDTMEKQLAASKVLYRSAGLAELDPDHAEHLTGKLGWSGFCQGWLGMLPAEAATQLLDRAGLTNEYVPVEAADGQPRHCGGCGAEFSALPGATAIICEGCGRTMDLGSAEIPCASCGAVMTLPAGADRTACPFCQSQVERVGLRLSARPGGRRLRLGQATGVEPARRVDQLVERRPPRPVLQGPQRIEHTTGPARVIICPRDHDPARPAGPQRA